ncbi:hypothetical protein A2961_04345 [Candidatus Woesebacteria bacterium RIFCSPLOWO2_01_FULL_39_21]|uniref:General secretion pathway GspH domain-containing protein n=1 Tax=Candidatus Woesebacteria bacterium RIFCSPLOWO2_01_FULL_39_21 TaxID=1802519 RepID=A0A1F8BLB0_9BACT|nr:MAG: hypothetical protein A2691_01815 [Candidatus Woesebacteria bacterium RIFCSPHIGHO2_01_FULL_39_23]OGM64459.1 MAG: hypothetical protein A2961_04345 [Candidatus Woesebacteria bacterium RIFCSPLOWO2_01_FULL_39_21]
MTKPVRESKGFTIVEILVVTVVLGIIFLVGTASYRDFSRRQVLESAVRQVRSDLNLAREWASSGRKPDDPLCTGVSESLSAYIFERTGGVGNGCIGAWRNNYRINASCTGGDVLDIKVANLPQSLCLNNFTDIEFRTNATYTPHSSGVDIRVNDLVTGREVVISVDESGAIR